MPLPRAGMLKIGAFSADAESRARFGAGFWDKTTADTVFGSGSIGTDKVVVVGNLDLGGHVFTNSGAPSNPSDLATKAYVDTTTSGSLTGVLHADGSVVATGALDMGSHKVVNIANPTNPQDAATKAYVDAQNLVIVPYTTNTVLTSAESGQVSTNTGASGDIQFTLPVFALGLAFKFAVTAAHYVKILNFDGSTVIFIGTTPSSAGGFVRSNQPGSMLEIIGTAAGQWMARVTGSWTIDQ